MWTFLSGVQETQIQPWQPNLHVWWQMGNLAQFYTLVEELSGGPLQFDEHIGNEQVCNILKSKHPKAAPLCEDAVLFGNPSPSPHLVHLEALTREVIWKAWLHTFGSAGPSGVNAKSWRHMYTSFGEASDCLCDAIAMWSRRLATSYVYPSSLEAFLLSCLIPLDKKPGVRPFVGEVLRGIIGKAVLYVIGDDIGDPVGSLQLCAGHDNGIEAGIQVMWAVVDNPATEAILLADASNTFDCFNRKVWLCNIQQLCTSLTAMVITMNQQPSILSVDGEVI